MEEVKDKQAPQVTEGKTTQYEKVTEGKAEILFPVSNGVFYNKVQEFNRDLTIAVISEFSENRKAEEMEKNSKKKQNTEGDNKEKEFEGITILEALSASGIRSMRFAKEISNVKKIMTNDMSKRAYENIQQNIDHNQVGDIVQANLDDATSLMYKSRGKFDQFDVVDIDPYGSASIFIDGAVQCVKSGGLLCVTCTDMAVLAGNHPETCYSKYNTIPFKTKACHEQALRILLYTISSTAARYQRYIVPLISFSIDYYVRVYVRVYQSPKHANLSALNHMKLWRCQNCFSFECVPMAELVKTSCLKAAEVPNFSQNCEHCNGKIRIGGPFWSSKLHDVNFTKQVLQHIKNKKENYGSYERLNGILTMITEELEDVPFYFISDQMSSVLKCDAPPSDVIWSALLNSGYKVSGFHGRLRSIKTNAPNRFVWDIMRKWVDVQNNEKMKQRLSKLEANHPAVKIFSKQASPDCDLTIVKNCMPDSVRMKIKRFPLMPPNWGPKARATVNKDGSLAMSANEKSRKFQGKRKLAKKRRETENKKMKEEQKVEE